VNHVAFRVLGAAAVTAAVYAAAEVIHFHFLCESHQAWLRLEADPSAVIRDDGFATARQGDALYVCTTEHCFGIVGCHQDAACYCASVQPPVTLARVLGGVRCELDHLTPSPLDGTGACRHAHCDKLVGP
jgi:hypothetical protein